MKKTLLIMALSTACNAMAQNTVNLFPLPAEMKTGTGSFSLNPDTRLVLEGGNLERTAAQLNSQVQKRLGFKLRTTKSFQGTNAIRLNFERMDKPIPGAYSLVIDQKGISIAGDNEAGVFYGVQTLLQLLPPGNQRPVNNKQPSSLNKRVSLPCLTITDWPRFAYRGMHLDVGRHFFPVEFIKRYIDYLATYKFNTFHWHLTEDQGWRIEIKKYPLLTEVGSCRDRTLTGRYGSNTYDSIRHCGFYTREQVKEIVRYASDRYITVIPEIEMPGHSTAALASYPFLGCTKGPYKVMDTWGVLDDVYCAGNDSTYRFIEDVLDEVMQLFPSRYIHIGGDECPKERWKACPVCQKRIKDEGLKDENALQSYFIGRIEKYLNSRGRSIIGWDEILEGGLAPNATVMSWRGEDGGIAAAKQGHHVIMTPGSHCYLDHSQSRNEDSLTIGGYLPLEKVYNYEPIPAGLNTEEAKHVLGAQGNVWTEYMDNPSKVEYMIFPRMVALSEVLWSPKDKRSWDDFEKRLPVLFNRLDQEQVNYSRAFYDLMASVIPSDDFNGIKWKLESRQKNGQIGYTQFPENQTFAAYTAPLPIRESGEWRACFLMEGKPVSCVAQRFMVNKATGRKIVLSVQPSKNYPGDGAFTLVNGVQNRKGLARSVEFLGFLTGCEAVIDMGTGVSYGKLTLHAFRQEGSWIYPPRRLTVFTSADGLTYSSQGYSDDLVEAGKGNGTMTVNFPVTQDRYIKVVMDNFGTIPAGNPGAGNPAWMFVDEIEVE